MLRIYQIHNLAEGLAKKKLGVVGAMMSALFLAGMYTMIMLIASKDLKLLIHLLISGWIYGMCYLLTKRAALAMAALFAWEFGITYIFLLGGSSGQEMAIF